MNITAESYGHAVVLNLKGELIEDALSALRREIQHQLSGKDVVDLVLNFENVPFVDSMGLEFLLDLQERLAEKFGQIRIAAPDENAEKKLALLREEMKKHGRDRARFGIEGWLRMHEPDPQRWAAAADGWRKLGADMVMLYPMYRIPKFEDQVETLRRFMEVAGG